LKYQAKGFMVAIMKGLMMVGEWSDIGSRWLWRTARDQDRCDGATPGQGFMVAIMKGLMMGVAAVRDQQAAEKKRDGLGDDVNGDAEVVGCAGEQPADVALRAEPQSPPVGETGGEGLTGEPSGAAVTRRETRRFVEEGPGICDPSTSGWGKRMVSRSVVLNVASSSES